MPEWQQRFDAAVDLLASRPQPAWLQDRISGLNAALFESYSAQQRLDEVLGRLDIAEIGSTLKAALSDVQRATPGASSARVGSLRKRFEAVNQMANRRDELAEKLLDTVADVELLAVQAVSHDALDTSSDSYLSKQFERLDSDLRSLEQARREVDAL